MRPSIACAVILASLAAGCKDPARYQAPVSKFHDASAVVIGAARVFYGTLNKAERDHYIDQQLAEGKPIIPVELAKVQVFDAAEIAVRIKTLDALAQFSDLLYHLANLNATASTNSAVATLQQSLTSLSGEVTSLSGANNTAFQNASKGVFPLLNTALDAFVNQKVEVALRKAVASAAQPLEEVIKALESDMLAASERRRDFLSSRRRQAIQQYRADLDAHANSVTLRADADLISHTEDQWEVFQTARPTDGLKAMRQAFAALTAFAEKPKKSESDFSTFAADMESFAQTARQVGQALQALQGK